MNRFRFDPSTGLLKDQLDSQFRGAIYLDIFRVESSNEKTIIKSTNKAGRKMSIILLSQSLNHFRDSNPKLRDWHDRLVTYKKKGMVRMGLCRKVFTEMFQMLKKNEYHYYREERIHLKKMAEYEAFLETKGFRIITKKLKKVA
jgi:hypothetical protein